MWHNENNLVSHSKSIVKLQCVVEVKNVHFSFLKRVGIFPTLCFSSRDIVMLFQMLSSYIQWMRRFFDAIWVVLSVSKSIG